MVDQIDMKRTEINADRDLRMLGYVSWVGSTSMEITMKLQQQPQVGVNFSRLSHRSGAILTQDLSYVVTNMDNSIVTILPTNW